MLSTSDQAMKTISSEHEGSMNNHIIELSKKVCLLTQVNRFWDLLKNRLDPLVNSSSNLIALLFALPYFYIQIYGFL
jgi:hypothetical protein